MLRPEMTTGQLWQIQRKKVLAQQTQEEEIQGLLGKLRENSELLSYYEQVSLGLQLRECLRRGKPGK